MSIFCQHPKPRCGRSPWFWSNPAGNVLWTWWFSIESRRNGHTDWYGSNGILDETHIFIMRGLTVGWINEKSEFPTNWFCSSWRYCCMIGRLINGLANDFLGARPWPCLCALFSLSQPPIPPLWTDISIRGWAHLFALERTLFSLIAYPDAPWCWNIYLHLPQTWHSFVGKYSSTMEHLAQAYRDKPRSGGIANRLSPIHKLSGAVYWRYRVSKNRARQTCTYWSS